MTPVLAARFLEPYYRGWAGSRFGCSRGGFVAIGTSPTLCGSSVTFIAVSAWFTHGLLLSGRQITEQIPATLKRFAPDLRIGSRTIRLVESKSKRCAVFD